MIDFFEQFKKKLTYGKLLQALWSDIDIQKAIVELNTKDQLFNKGINSDGETLGNYSPVSVQNYGKPAGHIRLYDSGDFYKSFKVQREGEDFTIIADTMKTSDTGQLTDLATVYGIDIIGLTNDSKKVLSQMVKSKIPSKIRGML